MIGRGEAQKILDQLNSSSGEWSVDEDRPEWRLIQLEEETGCALVIAKDCIALMPYDMPGGRAVTWETCTLRGWLNSNFYNSLSTDVRSKVIRSEIVTKDNCSLPGGNDTSDFVFLLSIEEYNEILPKTLRTARFHGSPSWWWLRSPGYSCTDVANVRPDGILDGGLSGHGFYSHCDCGGVRPALFLNLL
jgi:hypothetical protein